MSRSGNGPVLILGAGGHGKVVADLLDVMGRDVAGFIDGDESLHGKSVVGRPVLGGMNRLEHHAREVGAATVALAIGDNRVRLEHAREAARAGLEIATLVHPSAVVSSSASLAAGTVVCAGATVCCEAQLGEACVINTNAVVDHECQLGNAVHVAPAAALAGRVRLGDGVFVGLGARVLPCLEANAWAIIGAGAVVTRDIAGDVTVVGVPAKAIGE
ncbi:MAG: acetyltransferase [Planctomycetota bacterium]